MKSQSSLEVPKQVRSASFDEIQLEAKRHDDGRDARSTRTTSSSSSSCSPARSQDSSRGRRSATLRVPQLQSGQRSKSFDVSERGYGSSSSQQSSLGRDVRRPETPTIQVSGCYHCACVEEYKSLNLSRDEDDPSSREELDDEVDEGDDTSGEDDEDSELVDRSEGSPEIRVTLATFTDKEQPGDQVIETTPPPSPTVVPEIVPEMVQEDTSDIRGGLFPSRERRRSISSPKLARQEALTSYPVELPTVVSSTEDEERAEEEEDEEELGHVESGKCKFVVRDIFLTVPELKRDRAASVDSCFNNKNGHSEDTDTLTVPQQSIRSKSVDIVLPTEAQTRYTALLPGTEARPPRGWVRLVNGTRSLVPNTFNFLNVPPRPFQFLLVFCIMFCILLFLCLFSSYICCLLFLLLVPALLCMYVCVFNCFSLIRLDGAAIIETLIRERFNTFRRMASNVFVTRNSYCCCFQALRKGMTLSNEPVLITSMR